MKIHSWNVNGIRAVIRKGAIDAYFKKYDPDIVGLQEIKAMRDQVDYDWPQYEEFWHPAERKGYSGTAIFTKQKPLDMFTGFHPSVRKTKKLLDDQERDVLSEGRMMTMEFKKFFLVNVYRANAKDDLTRLYFIYKKWDPLFLGHCQELEKKKPVIFMGDLNVAHRDIDLARPKANIGKKGCTDEEREGFDNYLEAGFVDTLRERHPEKEGLYTWWSPWGGARDRNVGWRIDYVCASKSINKKITKAAIHPDVYGSDHCPVSVTLDI